MAPLPTAAKGHRSQGSPWSGYADSRMKYVLVTKDAAIREAALGAFSALDELVTHACWDEALGACDGADLIFVDLIATLDEPHKIAGYERFAEAKMVHPIAANTPLVLFSPPEDYALDYITGFPDFVALNLRRPITTKSFRLASGLL